MALSIIHTMYIEYQFRADVHLEVVDAMDERILSDLEASIAPFSWGLPSIAFPFDQHPGCLPRISASNRG
jgi:hypothetical protein